MSKSTLNIIKKKNGVCFNSPDFFLTFSDFLVSDGIDIVENINVIKGNYDFEKLAETAEAFNEFEGSYIAQDMESIDFIENVYDDVEIFTFPSGDVEIEDFTDSLKVANSKKGFFDAQINIGNIIYINRILSPKILLKIYKAAIVAKTEYFDSLRLPFHIKNILNNHDFLAILANVPPNSFEEENIFEDSVDIINNDYDDDFDLEGLIGSIREKIEIACEEAFKRLALDFGILDYFVSEGILIGDLVDAGMALLEGVEETDELREKLERQILKSLTDINVIALLMAAIRTEEDLSGGRLREVDVSDDPAYLYTDEVLGLAISNQIAGTKATFNFKRYDEAKPGILAELGPMVDDIFAGLIAGCMSKIFEE